MSREVVPLLGGESGRQEKTSGSGVELSSSPLHVPEVFMSHVNAVLTPRTRLRLAKLVVEDHWTYSAAAKMFMVAPRTARKWADRYRTEGPEGMADRSSRPRTSPSRTPQPVVRRIVALRWRKRLGPVQIAGRLGVPASTVHAVLVRCRINRLTYIDRVTGEPLRRYEHPYPGSMIHVDVTKFGNIRSPPGRSERARDSAAHGRAREGVSTPDRHRLRPHRDRRSFPGRLRGDLR